MTSSLLARTSQDSISAVGAKFAKTIQNEKPQTNETCAQALFEMMFALEMHPLLARKLTDPNRSDKDKQTLAKKVMQSIKSEKLAVEIVSELITQKWSKPDDLRLAIGEFGFASCIIALQDFTQLKAIEQDLFEVIVSQKDLMKADLATVRLCEFLSSPTRPIYSRIALIEELFQANQNSSKLHSISILLAKYAASVLYGGKYLSSLQQIAQKVAETRSVRVVDVITAVNPDAKQIERLEKLCQAKYNADIQLNVVVDKSVLGGLKISVNNEVFDFTLQSKFNKFRSDFEAEFKA
jgi:F-type H+-transporting ATPase subunit delta